MTKKLEETFNISPAEEEPVEEVEEETPTIEESTELTNILYSELKTTEKIDSALPLVQDLNQHDKEMDDIHQKALDAFNDLVQLGMNVEVHAGAKLLETANQMLKTAMEAKDSKVDRKLKMINLQLQKAKLDHNVKKSLPEGSELESDGAITIDRNELLKRIDNAQKDIKNDK
jgi:competence protein ComGC